MAQKKNPIILSPKITKVNIVTDQNKLSLDTGVSWETRVTGVLGEHISDNKIFSIYHPEHIE